MDKQRKVFTRGGVTVTLDDVRNLGRFVEIGIEGEENEADIARLNAVVAEAGLELSLRIGADYPELLMKRKKIKSLAITVLLQYDFVQRQSCLRRRK